MRTLPNLCILLALSAAGEAGDGHRPNLIFVLTDDQRWDTLGCLGNEFVQTPNLDKLAGDGILFEQAFVNSAICTPSRACYFLGKYERRHGVNFNSGTAMAPEAWKQSYPVLLREAGYFTGYVGKNHVPVGPSGYKSGIFESSFDFWYAAHGHLSFYPKQRHAIFRDAEADTQIEVIGEGAQSFLGTEESFLDGAVSFLDRRPADKPFCLSIAFNLPHAAGTSTMQMLPSDPALYRTAYRDRQDAIPLPPHYVAKADIAGPKVPADVFYTQFRQPSYDYVDTPEALRERMVREYQTVTGIDRLVGALRDQLAEQGLADNTVIIFASDHGVMHGEFGLGGKGINYEFCLRIPMIVMDGRVDSGRRGARSSELVMSIDVAPTLLELAGVEIPDSVQGRSLVPLLAGDSVEWRDAAFAENLWSTYFGNPRCESVRTAQWKYIRYFANDRSLFENLEGKGAYRVHPAHRQAYADWLTASIRGEQPDYEELFYLPDDPHEGKNLAGDPRHAAVLAEMRQRCQRLVREAKGDPDTPPWTVPWDEN